MESIFWIIGAGLSIAMGLLWSTFFAVCQATAGILYDAKSPKMRWFQRAASGCLLAGAVLIVAGGCLWFVG